MPIMCSLTTADEALEVAFEVGALRLCPKHPSNVIRTTADPEIRWKAYELAVSKIDRGLFSSRQSQLALAINQVIELAEAECHSNTRAYRAQRAAGCRARKQCPCSKPTCPTFGQSSFSTQVA